MAGRIAPYTFRLRPGKDDDIETEFDRLDPRIDKADVIRAALRAYFNLGHINPLPIPENASQDEIRKLQQLKIEGVELERIEKSADQMDDALDNLLGDF
jgi:hypothetical protein